MDWGVSTPVIKNRFSSNSTAAPHMDGDGVTVGGGVAVEAPETFQFTVRNGGCRDRLVRGCDDRPPG